MNKLSAVLSAALCASLSVSAFAQTSPATSTSANPVSSSNGQSGTLSNQTPKPIPYKQVGTTFGVNLNANGEKGPAQTQLPAGDIHSSDIVAATNNNNSLQQAYQVVRQQHYNFLVAKDLYFPQPSISLAPTILGGANSLYYNVNVTQKIFDWTQLKAMTASRHLFDARVFDSITLQQQLQFKMVQGFNETLKAKAAVRAQQETVDTLRKVCEYTYLGQGTRPKEDPCAFDTTGTVNLPSPDCVGADCPAYGSLLISDLLTASSNLNQAISARDTNLQNYKVACHNELALISAQSDGSACERFVDDPQPTQKEMEALEADAGNIALANRPDLNSLRKQLDSAKAMAQGLNWLSRLKLNATAGLTNGGSNSSSGSGSGGLYSSCAVGASCSSTSGSSPSPGSTMSFPLGSSSQSAYVGINASIDLTKTTRDEREAAKSVANQLAYARNDQAEAVVRDVANWAATIEDAYKQLNNSIPWRNAADEELKIYIAQFETTHIITIVELAQVIQQHALVVQTALSAKYNVAEAVAQYNLVVGRNQTQAPVTK